MVDDATLIDISAKLILKKLHEINFEFFLLIVNLNEHLNNDTTANRWLKADLRMLEVARCF